MRFKIDENLPAELVDILQNGGHEVKTVCDEELSGAKDSKIYDVCQKESRAIITLDVDFADIRSDNPEDSSGLVVLRPQSQSKLNVLRICQALLNAFETERLDGRLWIVEDERIRIRRGDG